MNSSQRYSLLTFVLLLLACRTWEQNVIKIGTITGGGTAENQVFQGVTFAANWTNSHGGLNIGGTTYTFEVVTRTASNSQLASVVQTLIETDNVTFIVGPQTQTRTQSAAGAASSANPNIPFFSLDETDSLYTLGYQNFWGLGPGASKHHTNTLSYVVQKDGSVVNFFSLAGQGDTVARQTVTDAVTIINANARAQLVYNNTYSTVSDAASVIDVTDQMDAINRANGEVLFLGSGDDGDLAVIDTVFSSSQFNARGQIAGSLLEDLDSPTLLAAAKYWIFAALWHPDMSYGTSGQFMGTTSQFINYVGGNVTEVYIPQGAAAVLAWQLAAIAAGDSFDTLDSFRAGMLQLRNNTAVLFWGGFQYDSQGRNIGKSPLVLQVVPTGEGDAVKVTLANTANDLTYPIPFDDGGDGSSVDVGLIVGVVIGGVVLLLVIVAIIIVAVLLVIRFKCHVIFLPRKDDDL